MDALTKLTSHVAAANESAKLAGKPPAARARTVPPAAVVRHLIDDGFGELACLSGQASEFAKSFTAIWHVS